VTARIAGAQASQRFEGFEFRRSVRLTLWSVYADRPGSAWIKSADYAAEPARDLRADLRQGLAFRLVQFVHRLQVHPEFRRGAEVLAQPQRRVRRDAALAVHDGLDAMGGYAQRPGVAQIGMI
jgi:hypothetical protein